MQLEELCFSCLTFNTILGAFTETQCWPRNLETLTLVAGLTSPSHDLGQVIYHFPVFFLTFIKEGILTALSVGSLSLVGFCDSVMMC